LHNWVCESRSYQCGERRYCITRKELLGVVYGLKKYRQHLLGRPIVVRTDHAALTFLMITPEPVGQQGRWLDLLSEYDINIKHRPGRVHSNSDALSRRPCEQSGGQACQQCLGTIAASGAARATGVEAPTTGQVQPSDDPRPAPPTSFWEESYDLPQWFVTDSPSADTAAKASFLESPTSSSILANQVDSSVSMALPVTLISTSSDTDAAMWVQAVTATPEPPSITLDEIRTAQVEDDNLLPVIQAVADQMRPAHADIRQYPEEARVLLAQWDSLLLQDGIL